MSELSARLSLFGFVTRSHRGKNTKLDEINSMIDWVPAEKEIKKHLRRTENAVGKPAYPGIVMFKTLVLQRMYNLSDHEMAEQLDDRMSFIHFCGFDEIGSTPDASTICRFRNELLGCGLCEKLFNLILGQLAKRGTFKAGISVDATVVESSRRPRTTLEVIPEDRREPDEPEVTISHSDDTEAAWLKKGKKSSYGYKVHMAADAETGLVISGHVTPANKSDMKGLSGVLDRLPEGTEGRCYADKGYASEDNRLLIKKHGLKDGIMSKAARNKPLTFWERIRNRCISPIRCGIERIFGTFKRSLGFGRSRYVGQAKVEQEFFIVALAYNLVHGRNLCISY